MKVSSMTDSKYLKKEDLDEHGGEMTVTIDSLKKVNVARDDEDPEYRWTVRYRELPKPMVLNATNIKRIAKAHGDDTDDWLGKQITVYHDPDIEFGGNIVGGLRVRQARRSGTQPTRNSLDDVNRKLNALADDDQPPF